MDWSWLLVLACPIMMVFMMFGMKGHGHGHGHGSSHSEHSSNDQEIQTQLNELKKQNEQMKQELQRLYK